MQGTGSHIAALSARVGLRVGTRLLWIVLVVLGVVTVTFFVARVVAGDPTALLVPPGSSAAVRHQAAVTLGLNKSLPEQYWIYLKQMAHGNLGTSISTSHSVSSDLRSRLPVTAELAVFSLIIAMVGGVLLGVIAATHQNRWPDHVVRTISLGGLSLSQFWLGLVLISLFFVKWHLLPGPDGQLPIGEVPPPHHTGSYVLDSLIAGNFHLLWISLRQLILPVLTMSLVALAPIARVTRTAMVDALQSDFVRTAVAMGHGRRKVRYFALRNALLPVITMLGGVVAFVLSGDILIEVVFAWPGIGQYALSGLQSADFPAIQGFVICAAVSVVLAYLLVDILYYFADPRTRS